MTTAVDEVFILSLNPGDLISLILKMYETPNEETRQKIIERIRTVEKELTDKAGNLI